MERLLRHLASTDAATQLMATAALQNMCSDAELARVAVSHGAHQWLDALVCSDAASEQLQRFAAGALLNINDHALGSPQGGTPLPDGSPAGGALGAATGALRPGSASGTPGSGGGGGGSGAGSGLEEATYSSEESPEGRRAQRKESFLRRGLGRRKGSARAVAPVTCSPPDGAPPSDGGIGGDGASGGGDGATGGGGGGGAGAGGGGGAGAAVPVMAVSERAQKAMDHRQSEHTGAQKEERLKQRMRHKMAQWRRERDEQARHAGGGGAGGGGAGGGGGGGAGGGGRGEDYDDAGGRCSLSIDELQENAELDAELQTERSDSGSSHKSFVSSVSSSACSYFTACSSLSTSTTSTDHGGAGGSRRGSCAAAPCALPV